MNTFPISIVVSDVFWFQCGRQFRHHFEDADARFSWDRVVLDVVLFTGVNDWFGIIASL